MVKYKVLGFDSEIEYLNYFFNTLLKTNRTYDYFVDWRKVKDNVKNYLFEISLLNSLTKIDLSEREDKLVKIISRYPEVIPVIPLIIAIREKNMIVLEIRAQLIYKEFKFNEQLNNDRIADIVEFCKKSGILNLFSEINDLYAYLLGMEVGLDSNARKNRSGKIFEDLVGLLLKIKLSDHQGFTLKKEDSSINIEGKRFDYAIYYNKNPKYVLECNFYATTGSKPSEVARSYRGLHTQCKDENLLLIWVTDGPAWHKMKNIIHENFKKIDYPMNYTILNEKIDSILNNLKK